MIELNLLPESLQKENKETQVDPELFKKIAICYVAVVVCLHLLLLGAFIMKTISKSSLNRRLLKVKDKISQIKAVKEELEALKSNDSVVSELLCVDTYYSKILYKTNKHLPQGMWFDSLRLSEDEFHLEGKVVSLQGDEMAIINIFLDNLKMDKDFINDFESFVLVSSERIDFRTREVARFIVSGKFK